MEKSQRAEFLFEADPEPSGGQHVDQEKQQTTTIAMLCCGKNSRAAQRSEDSRQEEAKLPSSRALFSRPAEPAASKLGAC